MLTLLLVGQAIVAAQGRVAIASEAQAKAMTPAALADLMLAPGHPPVDAAEVGPTGMVPPPPPGSPPQFDLRLFTRPRPAAEPGYCTRQRIAMTVLNPGASATVAIKGVERLLRLGRPCADGRAPYGTFADADTVAIVRDLEKDRRTRGKALPVAYVDRLPAGFAAPRYASGIAALAAVDLRQIDWAGPARRAGSLPDAVTRDLAALPESATAIAFYAGSWTGVVVRENGRITRVWLDRAIPAPF